jgi:hypothetical protein
MSPCVKFPVQKNNEEKMSEHWRTNYQTEANQKLQAEAAAAAERARREHEVEERKRETARREREDARIAKEKAEAERKAAAEAAKKARIARELVAKAEAKAREECEKAARVAEEAQREREEIARIKEELQREREEQARKSEEEQRKQEEEARIAEEKASIAAEEAVKEAKNSQREVANSVSLSLKKLGFVVKDIAAEGESLKILALKPSGAKAEFAVKLGGEMQYKLHNYAADKSANYEGQKCKKDIAEVEQLLEECYNVKLSDKALLWEENPDRKRKGSKELPTGGAAQTMSR